jgi:hypothetical protein
MPSVNAVGGMIFFMFADKLRYVKRGHDPWNREPYVDFCKMFAGTGTSRHGEWDLSAFMLSSLVQSQSSQFHVAWFSEDRLKLASTVGSLRYQC